jgi:hypothetical protein
VALSQRQLPNRSVSDGVDGDDAVHPHNAPATASMNTHRGAPRRSVIG